MYKATAAGGLCFCETRLAPVTRHSGSKRSLLIKKKMGQVILEAGPLYKN